MNHTRALLQGRQRLLEGRKKIVIYRTSPNQATQYTDTDELREAPVIFWVGPSDKFVVSSLHCPFKAIKICY